MFETPFTVVGTIVTDPKRRQVGDQEVVSFRVASNSRRRTAEGNWEPGNSLFVTVNCWGRLVTGVGAALGKGAPVIVVGTVYTSEYEDRDGVRRVIAGNAGHLGGTGCRAQHCAYREAGLHRRQNRQRGRCQGSDDGEATDTGEGEEPARLGV